VEVEVQVAVRVVVGCGGGGGQPAGSRAAGRWARWSADLIFWFLKMPSAESMLAHGTCLSREDFL
jgi:hypothetical protein